MELGIADHIWQDKRAAIAQTVDELGDNFKPAVRHGWMAYIRKAYPNGSASGRIALGQGQLVIDLYLSPSCSWVGLLTDPQLWLCLLASFLQ
jgi:hypothetical protein